MLLVERGQRFLDRADDHAAEADFFEEKLEKSLQALVVIHHEDRRLARLVLLQNVLIESGFLDPPAPADLNRGELPALHQIINRRQWNPEVFGRLLDR